MEPNREKLSRHPVLLFAFIAWPLQVALVASLLSLFAVG